MSKTVTLLQVGPSPIHGKGLFARQFIARNVRLGQYRGVVLSKKFVIDSNLNCTYMMAIKRGQKYIDGSDLHRNPMGYINHVPEGRKPNVKFGERKDGRVFVYAIRNIYPGEELLADYGYNAASKACSLDSNVH